MRSIITREEKDRVIKRNAWLVGGILIFLMVLSTLGFAFSNKDSNNSEGNQIVKYNGIKFIQNGEYWRFNVQGVELFTENNAEEVENISFTNYLTIQNYAGKPLYFVGNSPAYASLGSNLGNFVLRIGLACLNGENCTGDFPVKNCSVDNVINIKEVDYDSDYVENIVQDENCVFIQASLQNQTKYADALLFELLGMK